MAETVCAHRYSRAPAAGLLESSELWPRLEIHERLRASLRVVRSSSSAALLESWSVHSFDDGVDHIEILGQSRKSRRRRRNGDGDVLQPPATVTEQENEAMQSPRTRLQAHASNDTSTSSKIDQDTETWGRRFEDVNSRSKMRVCEPQPGSLSTVRLHCTSRVSERLQGSGLEAPREAEKRGDHHVISYSQKYQCHFPMLRKHGEIACR